MFEHELAGPRLGKRFDEVQDDPLERKAKILRVHLQR